MKSIVLIGMMGSGKSSIGRVLSERLSMNFIDTDALIEEMQGLSIDSMFQLHGEAYFRGLECDLVKKLSAMPPSVVATGGGTVLDPMNRIYLKQYGVLVYLDASPIQIEKNVDRDVHQRPLLKDNSVEVLLRVRRPIYEESAHFSIAVDHRSPEDITEEIIDKVRGVV